MESKDKLSSSPPPNIFQYLDYRKWLKDRLAFMQTGDRKFSKSWVARKAGIKTPQLLSMIIAGKRNLTDDRISHLAKALKIGGQETEYLGLLVKFSQAEDKEQRNQLLKRLRVGFQDGLFSRMSDEGMEIFRHWYLPAIRELVTTKGFSGDGNSISLRLGITCEEAETGLKLLSEKGFLTQKGLKWLRAEPSVHSMDRVSPLLLSSFHLQMLDKSYGAVSLPRDQRYFEACTWAVPTKSIPEVKSKIQRFFRELDEFIESHEHRDEVMQLNMQFFPLSRTSLKEP